MHPALVGFRSSRSWHSSLDALRLPPGDSTLYATNSSFALPERLTPDLKLAHALLSSRSV